MSAPLPTIQASRTPPGGLDPARVPQFVCLGFDDDGYSGLPESGSDGGLSWLLDVFSRHPSADGSKAAATFFVKGGNLDEGGPEPPALVRRALGRALREGHEIACHSRTHPHGAAVDWKAGTRKPLMDRDDWLREIDECVVRLSSLGDPASGVPAPELRGFRTPYLEYSGSTLDAVELRGFSYDSSIEEGFQADSPGGSSYWPYTLHEPSPGERWSAETLFSMTPVSGGRPGVLELPIGACHTPPDELCARYGARAGLRERVAGECLNHADGSQRLSGLDWNFWFQYHLGPDDFLAVLKYTLDLRLAGNRAPLVWGGHSDIYSPRYERDDLDVRELPLLKAGCAERQAALEEFIAWAASKPEVRLVSMNALAEWMRFPREA